VRECGQLLDPGTGTGGAAHVCNAVRCILAAERADVRHEVGIVRMCGTRTRSRVRRTRAYVFVFTSLPTTLPSLTLDCPSMDLAP
jgi:hypothetical protein